jgi:glycerate dehydrogenase
MKIVVLDGYTLNPGDHSWAPVQNAAPEGAGFTVYPRTTPNQVLERSQGAQVLLTNKTVLTANHFTKLPELKLILILATGVNAVDLKAAAARNICVCNVPEYGTHSVAQFVFAQILQLAHRSALHDKRVREGKWEECGEFCFWETPQIELRDLTLGILGFGRIGRAVAKLGNAFGMQVIAHSPRFNESTELAQAVSLDTLFSESHILTLHCSLNANNQHVVSRQTLDKMRPGAFLINTARGGLICESDLIGALESKRLAGAALDVCETEPMATTDPLLAAPNLHLTPHMAWGSLRARERLMATTGANLAAWLRGRPTYQVA